MLGGGGFKNLKITRFCFSLSSPECRKVRGLHQATLWYVKPYPPSCFDLYKNRSLTTAPRTIHVQAQRHSTGRLLPPLPHLLY
jgi:hypothetical protein